MLTAVAVSRIRVQLCCLKVKGPRDLTFQRSGGEVKTLGP